MEVIDLQESDRFLLSSTSKGNQPKWFFNNRYYKADALGYEGLAEAFVSELESRIVNSGFEFVDYRMCEIREISLEGYDSVYPGCYSENMLCNGEYIVSVYRILEQYYGSKTESIIRDYGPQLVDIVLDTVSKVTSIDKKLVNSYLAHIVMLDSIVLNEDRHLYNISAIKSVDGLYRLSPVFDNGLSLLSDIRMYKMGTPLLINIRRVKSRSFSTSFSKQLSYFNGVEPLLIKDVRTLIEAVADKYDIGGNTDAFNRARDVLKYRLTSLKGSAWEDA